MSSLGIKEKVVVITGAAQGVGQATATVFAENGANVLLIDIKKEELKQTTESLIKDYPNQQFHQFVCDLSESQQIKHLSAYYDTVFHQAPDVLVNNAAVVTIKPWLDCDEQDFDKVWTVNLKAVNLAVVEGRKQAIINVSSFTIHAGMPTIAGYVSAKSGVIGLTRTLSKELGKHNIRVNAVLPGFVDTPMNHHLDHHSRQNIARQTPLGRIAAPREIATSILFLASDLASFCSGTLLDVHGGMTL